MGNSGFFFFFQAVGVVVVVVSGHVAGRFVSVKQNGLRTKKMDL